MMSPLQDEFDMRLSHNFASEQLIISMLAIIRASTAGEKIGKTTSL